MVVSTHALFVVGVPSLSHTTVTFPAQLSEAVTVLTSGAGMDALQPNTIALGHVMEGGTLSITVMVWLTVLDGFPQSSTALQVSFLYMNLHKHPVLLHPILLQ